MGLFRLAVTRPLYGRFARGLGRIFGPGDGRLAARGGAAPFRIALDDGYWTRFALYHAPYEPEVAPCPARRRRRDTAVLRSGREQGLLDDPRRPLFDRVIAVEASHDTFQACPKMPGLWTM